MHSHFKGKPLFKGSQNTLRAFSHQAKANAKVEKKLKNKRNRSKKTFQTSKNIFAFTRCLLALKVSIFHFRISDSGFPRGLADPGGGGGANLLFNNLFPKSVWQ